MAFMLICERLAHGALQKGRLIAILPGKKERDQWYTPLQGAIYPAAVMV
jgi:hypothetical protein